MTELAPQIDASALMPLLKALGQVETELRQNTNKRLRQAAAECARGLVGDLRASAAASRTPQAVLVARTARAASDRLPVVKIGGPRGVGRRKTPAGRLLWGSEHGSDTGRFVAGSGGPYWIDPAVRRFRDGPAQGVYLAQVAGILHDAGVL